MALILHIETSSALCSAALAENGKLIEETLSENENDHAAQLAVTVKTLLQKQKTEPQELKAIALSTGPGSYTGLRIGASFAKGICHALDIPLLPISTLKIMAAGAQLLTGEKDILFAPLIDARRMEVYTAVLNPNNQFIRQPEAVVMESNDFIQILKSKKILFFGTGLPKTKHLLQHHNSLFADNYTLLASHMIEIAWHYYTDSEKQNITFFEPDYLKPFSGTARSSSECK